MATWRHYTLCLICKWMFPNMKYFLDPLIILYRYWYVVMISERHSFLYLKGKEVGKTQEVDEQRRREQSARKKTVETLVYLHSWGQKPYFPSASKSLVVEHQRNPSLRPASVQLLYSLPLNQKGNLQYSPSAFPYFTLTTTNRTNAVVKLATNWYKNHSFWTSSFPGRYWYRNAVWISILKFDMLLVSLLARWS